MSNNSALSDQQYRRLFSQMEDGFQVIELLYDGSKKIVDYRFLEVNQAFEQQTGLHGVTGKLGSEIAQGTGSHWLKAYNHVARTGEKIHIEDYNTVTQRWYDALAIPVEQSASPKIAVVFSDVTEKKRRESNLVLLDEIAGDRFRSFVAASSDLVYRMSPDWQEMYTLSGKDFLKDTLHPDRNWVDTYIPEKERPRIWEKIRSAIENKLPFEFEHQVIKADGSIGWTHSHATPLLDTKGNITEWLGAASDITLRKLHEENLHSFNIRLEQEVRDRTAELKESRDRLQSLFDTSLVQMSILHAVRNKNGDIVDLEIVIVNKELERVTGRTDLVGKSYATEFPGIRPAGIFDLVIKTIETGEPQQLEYFYPHEKINKWFACMFVKMDDGVVATNIDITARKQAEEERFKNYLLLQQSEQIALLGSWDYELLTGVFTWSEGMHRLFDIQKGMDIAPEIYLDYATKNGLPIAERIVGHIRSGDADFEETLEISVKGKVKLLHLKATVVTQTSGEPVRVLGVDMDISAMRAAEEKIRKMEAEQQLEVVRVSMETLEEERHRISESLHNGLGQVLYGAKISLLNLQQELSHHDFERIKSYTGNLVSDCIKEARRISHELMPATLEEFGLKAGIEDICDQLHEGVNFICKVTGLYGRLERYLELAVFRTIQELMINVVKHAGATQATAEVNVLQKEIRIQVSDNGQGITENPNRRKGIGMASIRSKIKLMNGTVDVKSAPGAGTTVTVIIPYDPALQKLRK